MGIPRSKILNKELEKRFCCPTKKKPTTFILSSTPQIQIKRVIDACFILCEIECIGVDKLARTYSMDPGTHQEAAKVCNRHIASVNLTNNCS